MDNEFNDVIFMMLQAAETDAPLPAGLLSYMLNNPSPLALRMAGKAVRERSTSNLDLETRTALTMRVAQVEKNDAAKPALIAWLHAVVEAGKPLMDALHTAWATPAGKLCAPDLLFAMRESPAAEEFTKTLLRSTDLDLLRVAAKARWAPCELMRHLATLWPTADNADRAKIVSAGQDAFAWLSKVAEPATWWDQFDDDKLVLAWAAKDYPRGYPWDANVYALQRLAAERLIPKWLTGQLTGRGIAARVGTLADATVRSWTDEMVHDLSALLDERVFASATRDRLVAHVRRCLELRVAKEIFPVHTLSPRDATAGGNLHEAVSYLLDSLVDDEHAWALLELMSADACQGSLALSAIVETVNTTLT